MSARHANKANRQEQTQPSRGGRGRGRGRPRGGFGGSDSGPLSYGPVPSIREVVIGAPVSIVLKVDQPTGRQVQGIVAELLTRGDHPRGIKVRLQDGRVGRVQKMVSEDEAKAGSAGLSGLGRNGENGMDETRVGTATAESINSVSRPRYSDFRTDGGEEPGREEVNLLDFVVRKGQKKGKGRKPNGTTDERQEHEEAEEQLDESLGGLTLSAQTVTCPVCGEFEGDEAAVAHHVDAHFA
ncbi:uncharacterized protein PAC_09411 [Phialocephala subalpina]|uniref:Uncharacterized protein n=1 Tax=Phialocephala subalpina TaxID=576137 RepID=A0A1L7X3B9_9HELO|nr:uncharacterized protein PAC_09411 [Phialocephala subalpina]